MKIAGISYLSCKAFLSSGGFFAVVAPIILGLVSTTQGVRQSQAQHADAAVPVYDVVSIKPSRGFGVSRNSDGTMSGGMRVGLRYTPDGFLAENTTVKSLIQTAYGVGNERISGGPDWLSSERYDIEAKMDDSAFDVLKKLSPQDLTLTRRRMLQALLADRFKLTVQHEFKELQVYFLVIGKNGPKFHESKPSEDTTTEPKGPDGQPLPAGPPQVTFGPDGMPHFAASSIPKGATQVSFGSDGLRHLTAPNIPISRLLATLSGSLGRPVLDKTGLAGNFDIMLEWAPEQRQLVPFPGASPDGQQSLPQLSSYASGPSLEKAVEEQLGLKLESGKGPVEIIVIDHVERPSKN